MIDASRFKQKIGDEVRVGFLTLFLVGHYRTGRVVRNKTGLKYYDAPFYGGCRAIDPLRDPYHRMIAHAAPHDPIVKTGLEVLKKGAA
jgi:hypothetical protein